MSIRKCINFAYIFCWFIGILFYADIKIVKQSITA